MLNLRLGVPKTLSHHPSRAHWCLLRKARAIPIWGHSVRAHTRHVRIHLKRSINIRARRRRVIYVYNKPRTIRETNILLLAFCNAYLMYRYENYHYFPAGYIILYYIGRGLMFYQFLFLFFCFIFFYRLPRVVK